MFLCAYERFYYTVVFLSSQQILGISGKVINISVVRGRPLPNYSNATRSNQHEYLLRLRLSQKRWHTLLHR